MTTGASSSRCLAARNNVPARGAAQQPIPVIAFVNGGSADPNERNVVALIARADEVIE